MCVVGVVWGEGGVQRRTGKESGIYVSKSPIFMWSTIIGRLHRCQGIWFKDC